MYMSLREENSFAFQYLEDSGFSGSLSCKPHSRIPFDQIIEMMINRSSKDIGGLSGNTQNRGATERWTRIQHLMVAMREHLNKKIRKNVNESRVELGAARMKRDERDVRNIKSCLDTWLP